MSTLTGMGPSRHPLLKAAALGATSGMRTMAGPLLATQHLRSRRARRRWGRGVGVMQCLELLVDKLPGVGARTAAAPLAARCAAGGLAAATVPTPLPRWRLFVAGGVSAVLFAHVTFHLRQWVTARLGVPNAVAGILEDACVALKGSWALRL